MIACPVCANITVLPSAIELTIERAGIHGRRVTCPSCGAIYSVVVQLLQDSPLSPKQLEQTRNQPR